MNRTSIEWTRSPGGEPGYTWNPVTGCTNGCSYCYARRMARRLRGRAGYPADEPFRPTFHRDRLQDPLRVQKPSRIFTCSMGDLFDPEVKEQWRCAVFAAMALGSHHHHRFFVLTKRPDLMRDYMLDIGETESTGLPEAIEQWVMDEGSPLLYDTMRLWPEGQWRWSEGQRGPYNEIELPGYAEWQGDRPLYHWPLPNVWLGVSAEDQVAADKRIPDLLATPAAVRFVSVEPLLGPVDIRQYLIHGGCHTFADGTAYPHMCLNGPEPFSDVPCPGSPPLDWVIVGAQTGPGAVKPDPEWVQDLLDQCERARVPVFLKDNLRWPAQRRAWPE